MNGEVEKCFEEIDELFRRLLACPVLDAIAGPRTGGVYLFSKGDEHVYVGCSKDLPGRHKGVIGRRPRESATVLALLIAIEAAGLKDNYRRSPMARNALMLASSMEAHIASAFKSIERLSFRFIAVESKRLQLLLKVYATLALNPTYDDLEFR